MTQKLSRSTDADFVAPKDSADAKARAWEDGHHDRAGHGKAAPTACNKPRSVRI